MTKEQGLRTEDSELLNYGRGQPECSACKNPMFTDDGVCCEDVKTPRVDVRQDPLQFLLEERGQIAKDEQTYQNQV